MEVRKQNTHYVLRDHTATRWLALVAFFPLVMMIFVFIGTMVSGEASLDDWRTPAIGIGLMSFGGFAIVSLLEYGLRWWEIRSIRRVYDDAWVTWPQRSNEEKWQQFAEKEYQKEINDAGFSFIPIVIVGVVVMVIGVAFTISAGEISIIFALAGFMLIVSGIVVGEWAINKRNIRSRYQRRKNMPPPSTLISQHSHYDEDLGIDSLRALEKIEYKTPGKTSQARIIFHIHARWWEGFMVDEYHATRWTVNVQVPKGYEEEAEALVERFRAEVIKPRKWWERL